ncbi:putative leader peptide [Streptomyces sp. NRRL F-5650]
MRHIGDRARSPSLRSGPMKQQADLTKRRAVDLCRVAAMLCRTF